jgi:Flp pilus assembly protein CpaB
MNLENKKQVAIIAIAIGLGVVTVFMVGQHIQNSINQQTKILADEFTRQNKEAVETIRQQVGQELANIKAQQQQLAAQQDQLRTQVVSGTLTTTPGGTAQARTDVAPFSYRMPAGKRALTINIDSLSAVGGLITPGDFVDIIAQLTVPQGSGKQDEEVTSMVFQNLEVLAVGASFNPSGDPIVYDSQQKARSLYVTLAVGPEEAGLLTFAQTKGKLQLALRSPKEKNTETVQVASWQALADFVSDKQGTELLLPRQKAAMEVIETDKKKENEVKPFIQIFKSGRESSLQ